MGAPHLTRSREFPLARTLCNLQRCSTMGDYLSALLKTLLNHMQPQHRRPYLQGFLHLHFLYVVTFFLFIFIFQNFRSLLRDRPSRKLDRVDSNSSCDGGTSSHLLMYMYPMYALLSLKSPNFGLNISGVGFRDSGLFVTRARGPTHLPPTQRVPRIWGCSRITLKKHQISSQAPRQQKS